MSEPVKAVFLSYAHEDAEAARRIAEALRASGVEVWFDQSELRGGDQWDTKIRGQIKSCALFMPVVSATTEERGEGYFRREWKLAVDRMQDMGSGKSFIVPVVIDDTLEAGADVPEEFLRFQWTRLPGGEASPEFAGQVKHLLDAPRHKPALKPNLPRPPTLPPEFRQAAQAKTAAQATAKKSKRPFALAIGLGALALSAGLIFLVMRRDQSGETNSFFPAMAKEGKSIAVLAFANLSDDKANDYLSDGISEEVLNVLAKVPGLKVSARTSAFYFKGKEVPVPEIAKQLGVAYVVEGSVRKQGNTVRITAQLIKAVDGFQVWNDTFTRDLKDIFAVQDEIAGLIAQNLQIKLAARRAAPTISVKAYESYLQASDLLRQNLTQKGREHVQALLQAAVAEDPQFLQARVGLVDALSRGGFGYLGGTIGKGADAGSMLSAARRELADARLIAPNDPWVAYAEALYYYQGEQNYATALAHITRARALMPNESEFLRLEARILRRLDRLDEAMPKWAEALKLDPLNVAIWRELSESHHLQRRFNEAAEATARLAVLEPERNWDLGTLGFRFLATAAPEAMEDFERTWRRLPAKTQAWRGSDSQPWHPKLPQWRNDRATLVHLAGTLARPATHLTELPAAIGSTVGRNAALATWTMLALSGAGEATPAKALAAAHLEAYGRFLDGLMATAGDDQWLSMGATWYVLNGDETRGRVLLAKLKEHERLGTDAYWRTYLLVWMLPAWSRLEPAEAADKFLQELDRPMSYLSLDEVASSQWVFRPLLLDARIRARLAGQKKWLTFLAERVPEYAEFKTKQ